MTEEKDPQTEGKAEEAEEKFIKAKDEAECKAKGGVWKAGRCIVGTKEEVTIEEIKALLEKYKEENEESIKELKSLYEEIIENMSEEEKTEEEVSFEDFLRFMFDEAKRKKKYPYYYPYYPKKKKEDVEEGNGEELPPGEGAVEETPKDEETLLRESLESISEKLREEARVEEQWTAPIVKSTKELVGHVREFLRVDQQLVGKPGDTINIGYVNDFDFGDFGTYGTATLANAAGTSVLATTSASVKEAGLFFYVPKKDVEVIDAGVLGRITDMCRRAALRAEDKYVLDVARNAAAIGLDKIEAGVDFDADWIAELIRAFQVAGKSVAPGDIVLYMSPKMHEALLKDVAGSMGLVFARPDVIRQGRLEEFMGVTIRIMSADQLPGVEQGAALQQRCAVALLKGRGTIFAPKRELLIETDKEPIERRTVFVATTALAFGLVDTNCAAYITTQVVP